MGSKVCAECHPGEASLHARSGHALTLLPAGRRSLSRSLDGTSVVDPERPEVTWTYQFREGQLGIKRQAPDRVESWVADYAFGSGHHATTFVSLLDPSIPTIIEHRLTHYTQENALGLTPGQRADRRMPGVTTHGLEPTPLAARKCFGCHSTQIAAGGDQKIDQTTMIPNVSCERCHGPGRAHAVAARRGAAESELSLPFGTDKWTSETLLQLCGTCHRHPSRAQPGRIRPDDPHLARFQPVGLMQSKCYVKSAALSIASPAMSRTRGPHRTAPHMTRSVSSVIALALIIGGGGAWPPHDRRRLQRVAAAAMCRMPHAESRFGPAHPLQRPLDPDSSGGRIVVSGRTAAVLTHGRPT